MEASQSHTSHEKHKAQLDRLGLGYRRGLLKVALEASPLQRAVSPPCNIRSVAIANVENQDDLLLVYLGTDTGDVFLFTWIKPVNLVSSEDNPNSNSNSISETTFGLTCNNNLGLSPVDCLCPLPRAGGLVVLLDKQVIVLDLFTLAILDRLSASKGASSLARAFGSSSPWEPANGNHGISAGKDAGLPSPHTPQTPRRTAGQGQLGRLFGSGRISSRRGSWNVLNAGESQSNSALNNKLDPVLENTGPNEHPNAKATNLDRFAVALKQKLLLYEVVKGMKVSKQGNSTGVFKIKEIPGPEEVVTIAWIGNIIITGTYQEYSMFSVVDGKATVLFSLPEDLISPPLLKVFPKDLEALLLMDALGVTLNASGDPTSSSLAFKEIPDAIGQSSTYVVSVKQGVIELYHRKTGAKVQSILISDAPVGPHLVSDDDDGKYLVIASAVKVYCLERVSLDEQLKELLRQRQFDEAIGLADESVVEIGLESAKEKLAIVHAQAGFLLLFDLQFKDAVDHFLQSTVMHPAEIFPFFPSMTERWRSMVPRVRYWSLHPPPQALQSVIENKLQAIQRSLLLQPVDMKDLSNGHNFLAATSRSRSSIVQEYTKQAIEQTIRYLKSVRTKDMALPMKEGVDSLLMKLYLKISATDEMESFASSANNCVVEEVENLLQESGQLRTLAFLYETKGMHARALQVWQTLSEGDRAEMPILQLAAAMEASRILETSSDHRLVRKHLKWIMTISQDLALQVLTSSKRSTRLPPDDVLQGLEPSESYVQQRYLQWLVQEQGVAESHYHTLFAVSLAKSVMMNLKGIADGSADGGIRNRLQDFLETSNYYDPSAVLTLIQDSELWREQAILFRKLGNELRVFQILALKLGDIDAAERYCTELGRPDAYMRLLDLYLKPGEGKEPMYSAAVHLLELHGTALDPVQVLEALSPDMPLQLAYGTIAKIIRTRAHLHRHGQVVKHLSRAENFEARMSRLEQRARQVRISDHSSCGSCHALFGTKLFALYPNDSVVCYKCFRSSGSSVDPVTGHDFHHDTHSSTS